MAGELEAMVRKVFDAVDRKDFDAVHQRSDDDIQGVDEVSRKWLRGRDAADEHWRRGLMAIDDIRTELGDFSETTIGEAGLVTFWVEQDYTLDGNAVHVSGPATAVFRRRGDEWRAVLFHSVPMPEESGGGDG
jgi:ketosteroid isomerase-like protein